MKRSKGINCFIIVILLLLLSACAPSVTIPIQYMPQNAVRYNGSVDVGEFQYLPAERNEVAPNQIENTAYGQIYIAANVNDYVKRATLLELEKTGFVLKKGSPMQISGEILEFKGDDFGRTVTFTFTIRYRIVNKNNKTKLLEKVYNADPKIMGKFGQASDYTSALNEIILSAYNKFIDDEDVYNLLKEQ